MSHASDSPKSRTGAASESESEGRPTVSLQNYFGAFDIDQVKEYVQAAGKTGQRGIYEPRDAELQRFSAEETVQRTIESDATYLSLGDGGTKATLTEWGQHLQISRYLGHGPSGIYTIEHESTPGPSMPGKRNQHLRNMIENAEGFGLDVSVPPGEWEQKTYWLRNRWPRVIFENPGIWELAQQWVIRDNVVIQQFVFRNFTDNPLTINYSTVFRLLIRELNFANLDNSFNKRTNKNHDEGPGPGGYGLVKLCGLSEQGEHQNEHGDKGPSSEIRSTDLNPDAVAAVMGCFINGEALMEGTYWEGSVTTLPKSVSSFVAGYKLVLLSTQRESWKQLLLTKEDVDIDGFLWKTQPPADIPLDAFLFNEPFYVGRNVEHILTVCAMPITEGPVWDYEAKDVDEEDKSPVIALTCGDMGGHRVCSSASYFAFKFLLEVCRSLRNDHPLVNRVKQTCLGHLRWVFKLAKRKDNGEFYRYYWASGNSVTFLGADLEIGDLVDILERAARNEDIPYIPQPLPDGLTDTPFQILKAYELYAFLERPIVGIKQNERTEPTTGDQQTGAPTTPIEGSTDEMHKAGTKPLSSTDTARAIQHELSKEKEKEKAEIRDFLNQSNDDIAMKWVKVLDEKNKRDAFAWPHSDRGGMDYFRLDDHVWIWNTIKAISILLDWEESVKNNRKKLRKMKGSEIDTDEWSHRWVDIMRKYMPTRVKREIIQCFTTVYDVSPERILAVTRSPRETRFEFHLRDTALFYHIVDGELMLGEEENRWLNLIEIQKRFASTLDMESDNPMAMGLAVLMANFAYYHDSDAINAFKESSRMLNMSMLTNGLFSGQISSDGEAEHSIHQHDRLLHVPFEIPYLLYTAQPEQVAPRKSQMGKKKKDEETTVILNGTIPFNDQIDLKSIIDIKEEWLYNYPSFLDFRTYRFGLSLYSLIYDIAVERNQDRTITSGDDKEDVQDRKGGDILTQAFDAWNMRDNLPSSTIYGPIKEGPTGHKVMMIDIGKKRSRARKITDINRWGDRCFNLENVWTRLSTSRTAENAKKRFICCRNCPVDYVMMCCVATPANEHPSLRLFFDRHSKGATDFEDRATRVFNTWETEFHCSFLQLDKPQGKKQNPDKAENKKSTIGGELMFKPLTRRLPKLDGQALRRASCSFKFYGDFFDRYWTCHYLDSYMGKTPEWDMDEYLGKDSRDLKRLFKDSDIYVWQQRKILELLLFHRIMSEVNVSTRNIVRKIQEKLSGDTADGTKEVTTSNFNPNGYFESLKTWAELHVILEFLDEDLESISNNVKSWNSREQDRRTEKPRWTNNDEKKYRDAINRAFLECQRDERGLLANKAAVSSLAKTLSYRRDEAKNDYDRYMSERNFHQNDNIKYFTYSTVIFLPLGFAASIYSMQASPPTDVLQHMVICSVVAFVVLLIIISSLPWWLQTLVHLKRIVSTWLQKLVQLRRSIKRFYSDSKDLYDFWKLFYTKVQFSFIDLFTLQVPSYIIFLKGQGTSSEVQKSRLANHSVPSLGDNISKTLKRDTREALEFSKSRGEVWPQSWNRIVKPWNNVMREDE